MSTFTFKSISGGGIKYKRDGGTFHSFISGGIIHVDWDNANTVNFNIVNYVVYPMIVGTDTIIIDGVTWTGTAEELQDRLIELSVFPDAGQSAITTADFVFNETPSGTVNGSNVTFTTANTPTSGTVRLYNNGIRLGTGEYSVSGSTITFTTAPLTGDNIVVDYLK